MAVETFPSQSWSFCSSVGLVPSCEKGCLQVGGSLRKWAFVLLEGRRGSSVLDG